MKFIGVLEGEDRWVGVLSADESGVSRLATIDQFWADAAGWQSRASDANQFVPRAGLTEIPYVPASARILCIGLNYRAHAAEGSFEVPDYPTIFGRWVGSLSVSGDVAPIPEDERGLDWEGEVAVYIGSRTESVDETDASAHVFGYSTFNDLTARRAQKLTAQWTLGKNGDFTGPMGPLVTKDEVGDLSDGLSVVTRVNGTEVQNGNTRDLIFSIESIIALISRTLTLQPGDVIVSGTPEGVGYVRTPPWYLAPGDVVEVEIDKLGILSTPVGDHTGSEPRLMAADFRNYLFAPDDPRVTSVRGLDAREYAEAVKSDSFAGPMIVGWAELYPEPFVGLTNDGSLREGLYRLEKLPESEAAPTAAMVEAAEALLAVLPGDLVEKLSYAVDAHEWRGWANPEFMQHDNGLRLDEMTAPVREAILGVVAASLSETGYRLVRDCMRINGFLGDEVDLPLLMNEFSYNFSLFGDPSLESPWGWQLFGHHVGVNCLVVGDQLVVSPVFLGAEPDEIDAGPLSGTRVFDQRIVLSRELMASLSESQRREAVVFEHMVDPAMPPGRIHPGDERHLGGCFQDNRVVPYEGILVSSLGADARELVSAVFSEFLAYLPDGPRAVRMREIEGFFDETWFSWIGGWEGDEPFYFRLQSPVVMIELDHHTGVFLTNTEPGAFHIHTVVRTPNGNDYGRALVRLALAR